MKDLFLSFCFRIGMVQTQGKQNKRVPILLLPDIVRAIEVLNETRNECGISSTNPYVFANGADGHISSWKALNTTACKADCTQPNLVTSTRLRKYVATVSQVQFKA